MDNSQKAKSSRDHDLPGSSDTGIMADQTQNTQKTVKCLQWARKKSVLLRLIHSQQYWSNFTTRNKTLWYLTSENIAPPFNECSGAIEGKGKVVSYSNNKY